MRKTFLGLLLSFIVQSALAAHSIAAVAGIPGALGEDDDWKRRYRGSYRLTNLSVPSVFTAPSETFSYSNALSSQVVPNDPYFSRSNSWGQGYGDLWGVKRIRADRAWDATRGSGVNIAIVDSGILWHEDNSSNLWENSAELKGRAGVDDDGNGYVDDIKGWDFASNDAVPTDENGHGTHVGGIAGATGFNGRGIIGAAPSAKVMRVRVLDSAGNGSVSSIANGIRYAARNGARVINMSFGGFLSSSGRATLQSAVNYAHSLGSILVAAIGNGGSNADGFSPANLDYVLGVGATDYYDQRAGFSNTGSKLDFMAPGVDILSLGSSAVNVGSPVTSNYYYASGTSMAAPFVSGAIALLLNRYPTANVFQMKEYLRQGALDLGAAGWDPFYGYGRIDVAKSLGLGSASKTSSSAQSATVSNEPTALSKSSQQALAVISDRTSVLTKASAQRDKKNPPPRRSGTGDPKSALTV